LNKKSAQKQKRICNNGFSQAVVPQKTICQLADQNQTKRHTKTPSKKQPIKNGLFFVVLLLLKLDNHWRTI